MREHLVFKPQRHFRSGDVSTCEKSGKFIKAYQIEIDYGRTIEAYRSSIDFDGENLMLTF